MKIKMKVLTALFFGMVPSSFSIAASVWYPTDGDINQIQISGGGFFGIFDDELNVSSSLPTLSYANNDKLDFTALTSGDYTVKNTSNFSATLTGSNRFKFGHSATGVLGSWSMETSASEFVGSPNFWQLTFSNSASVTFVADITPVVPLPPAAWFFGTSLVALVPLLGKRYKRILSDGVTANPQPT